MLSACLPAVDLDVTLLGSRKLEKTVSDFATAATRLDRTPSLLSCTAIMGKVHGSLARAGKVKSQTPKVST